MSKKYFYYINEEEKRKTTNEIVDREDFSDWEEFYGYELSRAEKVDAVDRLNEFVLLLREEYGKMVGADYVYLKDEEPKTKKKAKRKKK